MSVSYKLIPFFAIIDGLCLRFNLVSRARLCAHGNVKVRFSMGTKLCGERWRARSSLADVSGGHSTAFLGSKTKIKKFGPAWGLWGQVSCNLGKTRRASVWPISSQEISGVPRGYRRGFFDFLIRSYKNVSIPSNNSRLLFRFSLSR